MSSDSVDSVTIIGSGNMGHGIAQVAAMSGYDVTLRDIEEELLTEAVDSIEWSLEKLEDTLPEPPAAILGRIETTTHLDTAVADADLIVEAVPEKLSIKRTVFEEVDNAAPPHAILASNTSSLSITDIAAATDRPGQVVGTHFFNPPVKMDLVEVVHGEETTDETTRAAASFVESLGKTPIHVRKDVRGFVVNNVLLPFMMEPAWMLSAEETTVREADAAMVHQRGYPMGPFELADLTGLDISHDVYEEAGRPIPPALADRVDAGMLGKKTGRGYYDYDDGGAAYEQGDGEGFDTLRVEARMVNAAARLIGDGVATAEAIDTGTRLGAGFPEGICRRGDELGLDAVRETLERMHAETGDDRYEPDRHLVSLVDRGRTGVDAGAGFFRYDDDTGDYRYLNVESTDGVLSVTIDRPERHNALSQAVLDELVALFDSADPQEIRCVTVEGRGDEAFSAGADISEFTNVDGAEIPDMAGKMEAVAEFPRPVIAKIDGRCLGGGLELALACDLRIATERSELGFPEITLGLVPGSGGMYRLARHVGPARAKELVFRGTRIDASRAAELGLVNRAVSADTLEETVDSFVADVRDGPPVALRLAKSAIDQSGEMSLDTGLLIEQQAFGFLVETDDAAEGAAAFAEDREPEFEGQ